MSESAEEVSIVHQENARHDQHRRFVFVLSLLQPTWRSIYWIYRCWLGQETFSIHKWSQSTWESDKLFMCLLLYAWGSLEFRTCLDVQSHDWWRAWWFCARRQGTFAGLTLASTEALAQGSRKVRISEGAEAVERVQWAEDCLWTNRNSSWMEQVCPCAKGLTSGLERYFLWPGMTGAAPTLGLLPSVVP
jgi:hypothetical protein